MKQTSRSSGVEESDTSTSPSARVPPQKTARKATRAKSQSPLWRFFRVLGPGLITGASDDDPSGIGTYTTAGASLGYGTLWSALFTLPMMIGVQYLCAKVGMVTGRGLAGVLRRYYSPWILYPAVIGLLIANTINAGADIGAIAAAINLLLPAVPIIAMIVPIAILLIVLQIWGSYRLIANVFRLLTLALFAYIASVFFAHPDGWAVLRSTFLPGIQWNNVFFAMLVAILGTSISPYLFFWQSDQEVEEKISRGEISLEQRKGTTRRALRSARSDTIIGMVLSNVVMYCIILATAATLFKAGKHDVQSATDAAQALRPIAGNAASILLALGLIGAGCLAVPVLTGSAAYALSEALDWEYGLNKRPKEARGFYAVIAVATLVGMVINFLGINPITALFWSAVINGVLAPPLLVLLLLITNNRRIMGKWTNNLWLNLIAGFTTLVMFVAVIALFFTLKNG
jgi:NRAMP (natural resistance-associated macrophage protein)-like metal ion transporter